MKILNLEAIKKAAALPGEPLVTTNFDTTEVTSSTYCKQVPHFIQTDPGQFPLDALPEAARDMAAEVSRVFDVPPELPGMAALAALGAASGKSYKLTGAVNGCGNFANLYVIGGAPRGTGKSCIAELVRPILDSNAEMEADHRQRILPGLKAERAVVAKQLDAELKSITKSGMTPGEQLDADREIMKLQTTIDALDARLAASPTLWAANVTSERLGALLSVSGETSFIYSAEAGEVLRVFAGKYRRDDAGDFDLLLSGYTGEPVKVDRGSRGPVNLARPCLTLLLAAQPPVLRELFANAEAVERGLITRTLAFACEVEPREDDGREDVIDLTVSKRWEALLQSIIAERLKYPDTVRNVSCDPEARVVLRAFHNEAVRLRLGEFADVQGELSRWRENACRAALALAVGDAVDCTTLTADQAARAVRLVRWAQLSTLQLLTAGRTTARAILAKRVRAIIQSAGGQMTLRDLARVHSIEHGQARALAAAVPQSFTIEHKQGERGRPSEVMRLAE